MSKWLNCSFRKLPQMNIPSIIRILNTCKGVYVYTQECVWANVTSRISNNSLGNLSTSQRMNDHAHLREDSLDPSTLLHLHPKFSSIFDVEFSVMLIHATKNTEHRSFCQDTWQFQLLTTSLRGCFSIPTCPKCPKCHFFSSQWIYDEISWNYLHWN